MSLSRSSQIESCLWPAGFRRDVWMIVDGARDRGIFPLLLDTHLEYSCLYSGSLHPELELVAPYLVHLDYDHRGTRRLIQQAWGNSWGVFLRSDSRLESLRRHLRGFLVVLDPGGKRLVFRYYDPRVLRVYLPTCTPAELLTVFGPIENFWMEGSSPDTVLEFRFETNRLLAKTVRLEGSAGAV
jgi:hypothetical protein